MTRWKTFISFFLLLAVLSFITLAADPDYAEDFFFPLENRDIYIRKSGAITTTSWFYMQREGYRYGALNWPTRGNVDVHAISSGWVQETGYDKYTGLTIGVVSDLGLLVRYGHLSDWKVKRGDRIIIGQLIGVTGKTGRTTGKTLLYLEAQYKGRKVCISPYFKKTWFCVDPEESVFQYE